MAQDTPTGAREHRFIPIAVIGMGCRFPKAANVAAYWAMMLEGVDAITEVPSSRWDVDAHYDPRPATPCKVVTRCGGFLDAIDCFDPYFFGISPREAIRLDPQQRLLLEVTWEAMESAGIPKDRFVGSRTGVFTGVCTDDYITLQRGDLKNIDIYMGTGGSRGSTAGRLAFVYGLNGPTAAVDTACSSSLVAVHQACNSLQQGDCDMALAGGVNVVLHPGTAIAFSQANMLAPDGRCKAFDSRADGFVRSEGAGVVLLKPLAQALKDGDPVYAVIRSSASNNDGSSSPFMTPSRTGQAALMRRAYQRAGVAPDTVQYVEAHGTGTAVGDPVEVGALMDVLGEGRRADQVCILGSAKTNIGHLEAAAGVAGLIKAVLCLKHRTIPPNLHFLTPNPNIAWRDLPFKVPTTVTPWPETAGPARAGVNSFGISGTNAHVVLEEAPRQENIVAPGGGPSDTEEILVVSAHTPAALEAMAASYRDRLSDGAASQNLRDLCYAAAVRRTHHEHRLGLVGRSANELKGKLAAYLSGEMLPGVVKGAASVEFAQRPVFVFSGIGTQWPGMGSQLRSTEPVFRGALDQCDAAVRAITGWSLLEEIEKPAAHSRLSRVDIMQPAIFSIQVGLTALWRSWGVEPGATLGHSLGEIAAAHAAGALSLEDAVRIVCARSNLMHRASGLGHMATVGLSPEQAVKRIQEYDGRIALAAVNSPTSCTLSGDSAAVQVMVRALDAEGIFCRLLNVDVACHSHQMEPLRTELIAALAGITPRETAIPLYSTVLARCVSGSELGPEYWGRNLRQPVQFSGTMDAALGDGRRLFLEVSSNAALLSPIRQIAQHRNKSVVVAHSLRAGECERAALLESAGLLFTSGFRFEWDRLYPQGRFVPPPPYPWQRERFWFAEAQAGVEWPPRSLDTRWHQTKHPLLRLHWEPAAHPGTHCFEAELDLKSMPWLQDHGVDGMPLLPLAAYVEMALAASVELFGPGPRTLRKVQVDKPLFLSRERPARVQLVVGSRGRASQLVTTAAGPESPGSMSFQFYSREGAEPDQGSWNLLVSGQVDIHPEAAAPALTAPDLTPDGLDRAYEAHLTGEQFYAAIRGMEFGPTFRGVRQAWGSEKAALTAIELSPAAKVDAKSYLLYPALLDACFQSLFARVRKRRGLSLPFAIETLEISELPVPSEQLWCEVRALSSEAGVHADFGVFDAHGTCLIRISGYQNKLLESKATQASEVNRWLYENRWRKLARLEPASTSPGHWLIVADREDIGAKLRQALEAQGHTCLTARASSEPEELLAALQRFRLLGGCRGIVHLAGLEAATDSPLTAELLEAKTTRTCRSLLNLLHASGQVEWADVPRLFVVSQNAKDIGPEQQQALEPAQGPLAGLARTAAVEYRDFRVTQVDLESETSFELLVRELLQADDESEIALRGENRYGLRLTKFDTTDRAVTRNLLVSDEGPHSYRLESAGTGVFDGLKLHLLPRQPPGAGEVEIRVAAVGLNFLDVLKALNLAPGLPAGAKYFGMECSGRIVAVGDGVEGFKVGDQVIAMDSTASGCLRAFVTTRASAVSPKPPHLTLEEAATIPVAYQTAYYALCELARLRPGESVLIHSAAGGVGLAAMEIARQRGAVIFATAGNEEKRELLKRLGAAYTMNSRTLDFAREVMEYTQGRGVDVVLNSLAGEAIPRSLGVLATGGRFVEIGKRDIYADSQIGLLPFQKNLSFFAVDLLRMRMEKPAVVEELTREIMQRMADGSFRPLPYTAFPASQAADAFRHMAQGKHIGKIVITLPDEEVQVEDVPPPVPIRADATYLITGGLGALGIVFARRLVDQGARHLVLMGRNAPTATANEAIAELRSKGVHISVAAADVSDPAQLARVLADVRRSGPPIKGVLHAAGLTDDKTLQQLRWAHFVTVFAPKVLGGWNLHTQLQADQLDFFVLFSSAASVLGGGGQGNYGAANAFLDALAHYRRRAGLPALAVNWGPWADVGMAALADIRGNRLAERGLESIPVREGSEVLDLLLQQRPAQIAVMPIAWQVWAERFPEGLRVPYLAELSGEWSGHEMPEAAGKELRQTILACESDEHALHLLTEYLRTDVARILRIPEERLNSKVSLIRLGLDSLMAVEMKNRIDSDFDVRLPATKLLQGPSIIEVAEWLRSEVRTMATAAVGSGQDSAPRSSPVVNVDQLSDDEVTAMLDQILAEGGRG